MSRGHRLGIKEQGIEVVRKPINPAADMFLGVKLSTQNYDALLIGWDAQTLQNDVTFNGGNSTYC
ncbi:unnamed protein product, partial [marine sediment metagenome]